MLYTYVYLQSDLSAHAPAVWRLDTHYAVAVHEWQATRPAQAVAAVVSAGTGAQQVTLDTSQLAFKNLTTGSLAFDCDKLYEGYSRGCVSNSV